jgi:hypothetical protein
LFKMDSWRNSETIVELISQRITMSCSKWIAEEIQKLL